MPRYILRSDASPSGAVEFEGLDASAALQVASAHHLAEADLWEGDAYCVTLRRESGAHGGFWVIFRKHVEGETAQRTIQRVELLPS